MLGQTALSSKYGGKCASSLIASVSPDADVSVQIPHIPSKSNAKLLPTFVTAVTRPVEESLAAEDLDNIQLELETLLSKVALRYRVLKSEYELLDKDEKRVDRRSKLCEKPPPSPGKRKREDIRKSKTSLLKLSKNKTNSACSPAQSQNTDDSVDAVHFVQHQPKEHKIMMPKNDTPNKFWLSVEPYCMPLTNEDLRLLDDLLEQYSGPLVPPIPDLGGHYSATWATEDMRDVKNISNSNSSRPKSNTSPAALFPKAENKLDEAVTGPLTQRLVSALMEDSLRLDLSNADSNSSSENTNYSNYSFRPFSFMKHGIGIEKRLKKELIKQGILDYNEFSKDTEDDVLAEIKKLISELSAISEHNSSALKRLREAACDEIKRLEIKRKLDVVDHEILETYKKTVQSKAKRRPLAAEEQQEVLRLTTEQKTLSDELDRLK